MSLITSLVQNNPAPAGGDLVGDLVGNVTGNLTGAVVGTTISASGQITASGPEVHAVNTLTYADPVVVNAALASAYQITLTGATAVFGNPSNLVAGMVFSVRVIQDGTGGRALTFGNQYDWGIAGAPDLTTDTLNQWSMLYFHVISTTAIAATVGARGCTLT